MSNKKLFQSASKSAAVATTKNLAGGAAYALENRAALAQMAMTGCFNNTFYCSDKDQLSTIISLADKVDPEFIAKLAVYSRDHGNMKDMPSFLAAILSAKDSNLLAKIFPKVIDSPKMLRNFVQIVRSGAVGRKSFGTRIKRLINVYLESLTDEQLFNAKIGNEPKLSDILKMTHPKPSDKNRAALYGYLLDKPYNEADLCATVKAYEDFKKNPVGEVPNVSFQLLTALSLSDQHWKDMAESMTWTQLRINLNTLLRHSVLADNKIVDMVASRLCNPEQIKRAKAFPYQLFTAFQNVSDEMPSKITHALQKASDISLENVPAFEGKVYVLVDVSGSMNDPATGHRGSATSKTTCLDVAAVFASSILRKNPDAEVIPFDTAVHKNKLNPLDSIMTNAEKLAKFRGGGTDCSCALNYLNGKNAKGDLVVMISDNESWFNSGYNYRGTGMATEWKKFKKNNPKAKLICLDITPNTTSQVKSDNDVLNIGSFNDSVFNVIENFSKSGDDPNYWVNLINSVEI